MAPQVSEGEGYRSIQCNLDALQAGAAAGIFWIFRVFEFRTITCLPLVFVIVHKKTSDLRGEQYARKAGQEMKLVYISQGL